MKQAARFFGAGDAGIARLDRRHVYARDARGRAITFEERDEPESHEDRLVIPRSCVYVIALVIPQSPQTTARAPHALGGAAVALRYSLTSLVVGSLARCIRALGYVAIPCGKDTALSVPIAIDAGLGEASRTGRLISPRYGPNLRLAKVLTSLPLEVDRPVSFGVARFCSTCQKCARAYPARALNLDREPPYEVRGEFNTRGTGAVP